MSQDIPNAGHQKKTKGTTPVKYGPMPKSYMGLQPDWEITDNGRGLLEGSAKFVFEHALAGNDSDIPKVGTPHPADGRLLCWDVQTTYGKARIGYAQAKYIGIANGDMTRPEFSVSGSTGEQSIKFHPDFKQWEAEAQNDVQKIKRDENGYFVAFGLSMHTVDLESGAIFLLMHQTILMFLVIIFLGY